MVFGKEALEVVINIKANIKMIKNKDMVFSHGAMVMSIKEITLMILDKDMEKCIGVMALFIKVTG